MFLAEVWISHIPIPGWGWLGRNQSCRLPPQLGYLFHSECRFPSSVSHWVRRFFIDVSSFDSSTLCQRSSVFLIEVPSGLGGFSSIDLSGFPPQSPTGLGGFSPRHNDYVFSPITFYQSLIFFLSFPTGLGGFLSIDLAGFTSSVLPLGRRFFHQATNYTHTYAYTFDGAHV